MQIHFEKATSAHKEIILGWLDTPHMQEFWDNSQEHRDDILIFMNGRKEQSDYFGGIFSYWLGYHNNNPFAFIMTSEVLHSEENAAIWNKYISKTGKTYSIDFGIGDEKFVGRGLAAPTLSAFCDFFNAKIEPTTDRFFIDPDENNPRAKHVYAKAGFVEVGDFDVQEGFFDGQKSYLMVKSNLLSL